MRLVVNLDLAALKHQYGIEEYLIGHLWEIQENIGCW